MVKVEQMRVLARGDRYDPTEQRPEGDWAVTLFRKHDGEEWSAHLFPTLACIYDWYGANTYRYHVYVSAEQLFKRLTEAELIACWRHWHRVSPAKTSWQVAANLPHLPVITPPSRAAMAHEVWDLIQRKADRVRGLTPGVVPQDETLYHVDLPRLTEILGSPDTKLTKQCRIIAQRLLDLGRTSHQEEDLQAEIAGLAKRGLLKTKQDPWLVFRYYAPVLADLATLDYPGRRKPPTGAS